MHFAPTSPASGRHSLLIWKITRRYPYSLYGLATCKLRLLQLREAPSPIASGRRLLPQSHSEFALVDSRLWLSSMDLRCSDDATSPVQIGGEGSALLSTAYTRENHSMPIRSSSHGAAYHSVVCSMSQTLPACARNPTSPEPSADSAPIAPMAWKRRFPCIVREARSALSNMKKVSSKGKRSHSPTQTIFSRQVCAYCTCHDSLCNSKRGSER